MLFHKIFVLMYTHKHVHMWTQLSVHTPIYNTRLQTCIKLHRQKLCRSPYSSLRNTDQQQLLKNAKCVPWKQGKTSHLAFWNVPRLPAGLSHPGEDAGCRGRQSVGPTRRGRRTLHEVWVLWAWGHPCHTLGGQHYLLSEVWCPVWGLPWKPLLATLFSEK